MSFINPKLATSSRHPIWKTRMIKKKTAATNVKHFHPIVSLLWLFLVTRLAQICQNNSKRLSITNAKFIKLFELTMLMMQKMK